MEHVALPYLTTRGSHGIELLEINKSTGKITNQHKISNKVCRVMKFSTSGLKLAWCDGSNLQVMNTKSNEIIFSQPLSRTYVLAFSPDEDILASWEPYAVTKEYPQGKANLQLWNLSNGNCVYETVQKKFDGWEPIWIKQLGVCAKHNGNTLNFYKDNNFDKVAAKLQLDNLDAFSISPNNKPPIRVACFIRGRKGSPSSVRLFKYPKFSHSDVVANKSFFKADSVSLLWNKQGTSVLIKTAVDVDTTGSSYYGEQNLHFLSSTGSSSMVSLSKKGPIYDAAWASNSIQFCVVFGFMPAKASIFNLKCDPIFEFGPTPKNVCFFNPHGNLIALAGFGNLRGNIEIWDFEKKKQITQFQSPDTTHFEWCGDGSHFLTATTAPRLRVGNGFKLWHFKNGLCLEEKAEGELLEAVWQPKSEGTYPKPVIGQISEQEVKAAISASKPTSYVPPHARGNPEYANKSRLLADDELPPQPLSKSQKKRQRRANKDKPANPSLPQGPSFTLPTARNSEQQDALAMAKYLLGDSPATAVSNNSKVSNQVPDENQKRIKALNKKLTGIERLKRAQSEGKSLDQQQIEKLKTETSVREQLEKLQLLS